MARQSSDVSITREVDEEATAVRVTAMIAHNDHYFTPRYLTLRFTVYDTLEGFLGAELLFNDPGESAITGRDKSHVRVELGLDTLKRLHREIGKAIREAEKRASDETPVAERWCF